MKMFKCLLSFVMLLIATITMAANAVPAKPAAKPATVATAAPVAAAPQAFYLIDAKLIAKSSFWNFSKDQVILNPRMILTPGNAANVRAVNEMVVGDLPEKIASGITMHFIMKPYSDGMHLSGNVILRAGGDKLKNDNKGKSMALAQAGEAWFVAKIDKLPQTIEVTDVKCGDHEYALVLTVSASDGKVPAETKAKKQ